ncbi:conserved hypothetical protein [Microbacterium sp. C448]|uniref:DUF4349 domain-containing protein n=1 Tax=Microbacterium sp. C448 TaxID=1177594 RepID=UPI0003DE2C3E|nr:DUF4349 domain-containing protein [Microbacterium sp. C448]CDK00017.1 conserved hypothetical protein [Microbacterium sp. C448]
MNTTQDASHADALPEVTDETITRIETGVFAEIGADRRRRSARRGRVWAGVGAAAAVVVVAAIVGPSLAGGFGGFSGASNEAGQPAIGQVQDGDMAVIPESVDGARADGSVIEGGAIAGSDATAESDASGDRELIASGSLSLRVDDIDASAAAVADAAEARGGYVESLNVGTNGLVMDIDGMTTMPAAPNGAWVQVRVPADQLTSMIDELGSLGEVTASNISRQDVTEQAVDLRARITSAETSVARLTELMSQSGSVADLIAAESALAERQATLESLQQQLEMLEGQVAMSSLSVDLTLAQETVEADPAGFGDGLVAGWNGLIATLNGIVIGLGFLLPWIVVIAVAGVIAWAIRRAIRRGRMRRAELRSRETVTSSTGRDGEGGPASRD